jgi:hypothetical protein
MKIFILACMVFILAISTLLLIRTYLSIKAHKKLLNRNKGVNNILSPKSKL